MNHILQKIISSNKRICLTLLAFTFLAYAWILPAPFKTVDDYFCIVDNPQIRSIESLPQIFSSSFFGDNSYYRPLVYTSFMVEYHLFKLNSFFYNLTNVLLHFGCACAVLLIVMMLAKDRVTSFATAVLFVLHPISWEAVTNIPGRAILLCAIFFLYSFCFFMKACERRENSAGRHILSLIMFIAALLSKESATVLPLVLLSFIAINPLAIDRKRAFQMVIPFVAILLVYLIWRRYLGVVAGVHWESVGWFIAGIIAFLKSCIDHLLILILPINLYFDRSAPLVTNIPTAIVVICFWVTVTALFIFRTKNKVLHFLGWWIALNLLVVSQLIPVRVSELEISTADHFLYLSAAGIFAMTVMAFRHFYNRQIINPVIIRLFIVCYFIFLWLSTVSQTIYAKEQIAMFTETLRHNPADSRVRLSLATAYAFAGRFDLAEANYRQVLEINPWEVRARIGLGVALCDQGNCAQAIREYDKVVNAGQLESLLINNRHIAAKRLIEQYQARLEKEPSTPGLHYSLGVMYAHLKKNEEAIKEYQKEIEINPVHPQALFNLASWSKAVGERAEAIDYYERFKAVSTVQNPLYKTAQSQLEELRKMQ